jgi:hypothetical protein
MAVSFNETVQVGRSSYHVQTEYYKSAGKIISNIFKDGMAVKRLERNVDEQRDLDEQIKEFHTTVVGRLKNPVPVKKEATEQRAFPLTQEQEKLIADAIYPHFGVAAYLAISDARTGASSPSEFIDRVLSGVDEKVAGELRAKLASILMKEETMKPESTREFPESELLKILSPHLGVMAGTVVESAKATWNGSVDRLLDIILKEIDEPAKPEVVEKVKALFPEGGGEVKTTEGGEKMAEQKQSPLERRMEKKELELLLPILQQFFGISAYSVADEAYQASGGVVKDFINTLLSEVEEEKRSELEKKLMDKLAGT